MAPATTSTNPLDSLASTALPPAATISPAQRPRLDDTDSSQVVAHQRTPDPAGSLVPDIFRYTPVPTFVLDAHLRLIHVSESYCAVSRLPDREQLLGLHVDDLCARAALPSNALVREGIRIAQETGSPSKLDELLHARIWTLRTVVIRHEAFQCFLMEVQDTTEAHRRQLELEERLYTNETFKILVDTVKDYAIFMLDPQGNVATWNAGAHRFKGYTKTEIIGKHFSNFYSQQDRDDDKPGRELRDALRDGRCEDEGWRIRKDGSKFWYVPWKYTYPCASAQHCSVDIGLN